MPPVGDQEQIEGGAAAATATPAEGSHPPAVAANEPAAEAAPAAESPPAAEAAEATGSEREVPQSLLTKAGKPEAESAPAESDKPAEAEKPAEAPAEKPAEAEKPAVEEPQKPAEIEAEKSTELAPIDYFAAETGVKIPETLTLDDAQRTELVGALDAFRADPAKGAQALVDLHVKGMTAYAEEYNRQQWESFETMKSDWEKATLADPVIGGSGHQAAMADAAYVRDTILARAKIDAKEWDRMCDITGLGNHPVFLKFVHAVRPFIGEPELPTMNGNPTHDNGRAPKQGKRIQYSHPTSQPQS